MTAWKCEKCDCNCILNASVDIGTPWLCPIMGKAVDWKKTDGGIRQDVEQLIQKYSNEHPDYYGGKDNPYEAIKVIEANGWMEGFCLGNVHKYTVREGKKTPDALKDLRKARDYLNFYIDYLERSENQ